MTHNGTVIASFGRRFLVEFDDGRILDCTAYGKKSGIVCGDRVFGTTLNNEQGVIEAVAPRATLLLRADQFRQKLIAANLDQTIFVCAAEPTLYEELLNRAMIASEAAGIKFIIVANKIDLPQSAALLDKLAPYRQLGYTVLPLSAKRDAQPAMALLEGHRSVVIGQSGVGKSTLINALIPNAGARTREISQALQAGKHTTTHSQLYRLADGWLIDAPGVQEYGLGHLDSAALSDAFIEFRPYFGQCRFQDCRHLNEPGCAIDAAVERGAVTGARLGYYRKFAGELVTQRASSGR